MSDEKSCVNYLRAVALLVSVLVSYHPRAVIFLKLKGRRNGPTSPLHRAGYPIDALLMARDNDVVLVPEGYHPVVSAPGYTTYYLNVLAGSAQSLANSDDPQYTWVKESYSSVGTQATPTSQSV